MKLQTDGDIEVSLQETVTMEIEATDTAFLAHTGAISVGQWTQVEHPSPSREVRRFIITEAFSTNFSFVTGFDFSLGEAGTISANAHPQGGSRQRNHILQIVVLMITMVS